jgi:hypothetical protein
MQPGCPKRLWIIRLTTCCLSSTNNQLFDWTAEKARDIQQLRDWFL